MKTKKGIWVDLIHAASGQKPLDIVTPDTVYVRMSSYGPFLVRVFTRQPAEVKIHVDGKTLHTGQIGQGINMIGTASDGKPFVFAAPDEVEMPETSREICRDGQGVLFPEIEEPAAPAKGQASQTHGLVAVAVKFSEQVVKGDKPEIVFFQMNLPADHAKAVAANLHRLIPPEGVPGRRGCSCCP